MGNVELQKIGGGVIQSKFEKSFERVMENLQDPNTPYKTQRKITIELTFAQNEERDDVQVGISVKEKLAPQSPCATAFSMGKNFKTGEIAIHEYGKLVSGQLGFDDFVEETAEVEVDPNTGEVTDDAIINFRRAAQ